jgi:two-component system, cell cycle sensor histidine kinase and response regulator CckA
VTDIRAALEKANARIAELEARLRADEPRRMLFEHALDLMCVAGPDGYFKELNASWTSALGWTLEELIAVPFMHFVHPEDLEATRKAAERLAKGAEVTAFENRYRHKDGSYRWLLWNAVFDRDAMRILAVARDVTEFRKTRQALEETEAAYRQLFDGMLDGFSYHDMIFDEAGNPVDYRFRAVNPAFEEMTGLKAEKLVGRRVLEVLPGTEKHWIEVFGGVAKTGQPVRYENYSQEFDKWFEVLAFRPGEGQFACTFHDITARKKAEAERARLQAQVEQAQKLESLGMMAGGIAHDFNNLLTAILGGIELAVADMPSDVGAAKSDLGTATAAAERARELCRQMLTYAGRAETQKEAIDLVALTREIVSLASPSLKKKVSVKVECPPSPLRVVADRSQISQVLLNLVLNAGDAIGDNEGRIAVRTGVRPFSADELGRFRGTRGLSAGSYAFVEVRDTGLGMSEETLSKIFEPFFTTKFAGRGLGLSATLGIVRAHEGAILVESEPGKGTRFLFVLPFAGEQVEGPAIARPEERKWAPSGTILLCDDESAVRRVTARLVNLLGFDVLEASDGQQAVDFFHDRASEFRAVLLDMMMPKKSGLEVLPLLRERRADIPVVLMSGYDENQLASGLDDARITFLRKPFRKDDLERALRQVLEGPR